MVVSSNSASALGKITIAWDDAADEETMLERIITQKYLAIFPRRSGGLVGVPPYGLSEDLPQRDQQSVGVDQHIEADPPSELPSTEYATNASAVQNAIVTLNGESSNPTGDNGGTMLWWDKKN